MHSPAFSAVFQLTGQKTKRIRLGSNLNARRAKLREQRKNKLHGLSYFYFSRFLKPMFEMKCSVNSEHFCALKSNRI